MDTFFVILQVLAVLLLGTVHFYPCTKKPDTSELKPLGFALVALGGVVYLVTAVLIHLDSERQQQRIMELLQIIANHVMTTPAGPSVPIAATSGGVISITLPKDRAAVVARDYVEGTASAGIREVWLVVHPTDTSSYWVQAPASVRPGGTWRDMVYFGRSGDVDKGKGFEVVAIAEPLEPLLEGDYGSAWPKAKWVSEPILVYRQ